MTLDEVMYRGNSTGRDSRKFPFKINSHRHDNIQASIRDGNQVSWTRVTQPVTHGKGNGSIWEDLDEVSET